MGWGVRPVGCGPGRNRRWVTLRDAPTGVRGLLVRWRKRVFACLDRDCRTRTWTEQAALAEPRRVLAARAFGASWSTVWAAIAREARARVVAPAEMPAPAM